MADYLLYWKIFWDDHPNGWTKPPDFLWHTGHLYWNKVKPGDIFWAVASGGDQSPNEWRLVQRMVIEEKYKRPEFARPNAFRGDPKKSEAYHVHDQKDLPPLLHQLEFLKGSPITDTGRKIGGAIQLARRLTENDRAMLEDYVLGLVRFDPKGLGPDGLEGVSEDDFRPRKTSKGAGFGDHETNCKVERAAVKAVTEWYEADGWTVKSVEVERCGYDLHCIRTLEEKHVEVKGVQGDTVAFVITAGEVRQAETDSDFVLCVVTSVLTPTPSLNFYNSSEFAAEVDLRPLAYRASLRTST